MQELDFFQEHIWKPFEYFGFKSHLLYLDSHVIIDTWIVLFVLLIFSLISQYYVKRQNIISFMILSTVKSFKELFGQNIEVFHRPYFYFIFSLFLFILFCNLIAIIPFVEEPTTNVNTTLALGIISFMYVQIASIKVHGIKEYIKEYFSPFFLLFPLNVIGEVAKVISLSFRLFGNIFGGSIISRLWVSAISTSWITEIIALGPNLIIVVFFILFEGFIQAFVFTMLTLTYLSVAIQHEEEEHEDTAEIEHKTKRIEL